MKKSELSFKCVLKDAAEEEYIKKKLGIKNAIITCNHFLRFYDKRLETTGSAMYFCDWDNPIVSLKDAIKLIKSIEPDAPRFDIKLREEVLVSDVDSDIWELCDFARVNADYFMMIGYGYGHKLIKYEGNEKYHGTKDAPDGWWECENGKPVWKTK